MKTQITMPKSELLNLLTRMNWSESSIDEVDKRLTGFYGIIKISPHEIQYSDAKNWRVSEDKVLAMLQNKFPKSKLFIINEKS